MTPDRVAAVVVTHNRSEVLAETLRATHAQSKAADRVYVVDNASGDGTADLLRKEFPDAVHLLQPENLGCSGGLARGMEVARADGFDAYWLLDDDSPPEPHALDTLLFTRTNGAAGAGIVGCQGGVVRFGRIRHLDESRMRSQPRMADGLVSVDFVLLDGSLVARSVVDTIGLPRVDYFMMLEDVEYSLRAARAGFDVLAVGRDLMSRRHLGSVAGSALWRGYYQSRNHVRMALDFRSPRLVVGCAVRQAHFMVAALRAPNRRWERIRLRSLGVRDGLRGRMGRRVEPDSPAG